MRKASLAGRLLALLLVFGVAGPASATVIGDTFVGTNGDDLSGRTATGTNGGFVWTDQNGHVGVLEINASNQLKINSPNTDLYTAVTVGSNDQYAQAQYYMTAGSDSFPVVIRASFSGGQATFYGTRLNSGNFELWACVAGSFTRIGLVAGTLSAGDTIRVEATGTSVSVKQNGTTIIGPVTDNTVTAGVPGIQARGGDAATDPFIDTFEGGPTGGGGGGGGTTTGGHFLNTMGVGK